MSESTNPPELVDVDLHGVTVKLPKEQAEKVIAGRQAQKEELRKAIEKSGGLEVERQAAAARAEEAQRTAEIERASKAGEIETVKKLLKEENEKLKAESLEDKLEMLLSRKDTVAEGASRYLLPQLRASCKYDGTNKTLQVMDEGGRLRAGPDGKPMTADAFIDSLIEAQPILRKASGTQGSGAAGGKGANGAKIPTMTVAEYNAAILDPNRAQAVAQKIAARELTVV